MRQKLAIVLLSLLATPCLANICPQSDHVPQPGDGVGDGCTTTYRGIDLDYIPNIGFYKPTFTPSCRKHDKCWTMLGVDYDQCDAQFLQDMKGSCDSKWNQWIAPAHNLECKMTANMYRAALELHRDEDSTVEPYYQSKALERSRALETLVDTNQCGTTPERTTLYAQILIDRINNAFMAGAGRRPTIYEFLRAANLGDLVADPAGWQAQLAAYAANSAAFPPPQVGWWQYSAGEYGVTFSATPVLPNTRYDWKVPDVREDTPSFSLSFWPPMFNQTVRFAGFIKATNRSTGVRNMALVETSIVLPGTCAPNNGPWVNCQ